MGGRQTDPTPSDPMASRPPQPLDALVVRFSSVGHKTSAARTG